MSGRNNNLREAANRSIKISGGTHPNLLQKNNLKLQEYQLRIFVFVCVSVNRPFAFMWKVNQ